MMMPSFISMISIMIAVMVVGARRSRPGVPLPLIVAAAVLQTAVTLYDFYTMGIPVP